MPTALETHSLVGVPHCQPIIETAGTRSVGIGCRLPEPYTLQTIRKLAFNCPPGKYTDRYEARYSENLVAIQVNLITHTDTPGWRWRPLRATETPVPIPSTQCQLLILPTYTRAYSKYTHTRAYSKYTHTRAYSKYTHTHEHTVSTHTHTSIQ